MSDGAKFQLPLAKGTEPGPTIVSPTVVRVAGTDARSPEGQAIINRAQGVLGQFQLGMRQSYYAGQLEVQGARRDYDGFSLHYQNIQGQEQITIEPYPVVALPIKPPPQLPDYIMIEMLWMEDVREDPPHPRTYYNPTGIVASSGGSTPGTARYQNTMHASKSEAGGQKGLRYAGRHSLDWTLTIKAPKKAKQQVVTQTLLEEKNILVVDPEGYSKETSENFATDQRRADRYLLDMKVFRKEFGSETDLVIETKGQWVPAANQISQVNPGFPGKGLGVDVILGVEYFQWWFAGQVGNWTVSIDVEYPEGQSLDEQFVSIQPGTHEEDQWIFDHPPVPPIPVTVRATAFFGGVYDEDGNIEERAIVPAPGKTVSEYFVDKTMTLSAVNPNRFVEQRISSGLHPYFYQGWTLGPETYEKIATLTYSHMYGMQLAVPSQTE